MKIFNTKKKNYCFSIFKSDRDFALKVTSEYNIPFIWFARELSGLHEIMTACSFAEYKSYKSNEGFHEYVIEEAPFEIPVFVSNSKYQYTPLNTLSINRQCKEILFQLDAVIESITIKSNKGTITLTPKDSFFHNLVTPIYRKKLVYQATTFKEGIDSEIDFVDRILKDFFISLKSKTELNNFQLYVVFGLVLVHFGIYRGKPLKSEEDFKSNPTEAQDYKHYLYDIVKTRLKNKLPNNY